MKNFICLLSGVTGVCTFFAALTLAAVGENVTVYAVTCLLSFVISAVTVN